jgi:hypothetical protein
MSARCGSALRRKLLAASKMRRPIAHNRRTTMPPSSPTIKPGSTQAAAALVGFTIDADQPGKASFGSRYGRK